MTKIKMQATAIALLVAVFLTFGFAYFYSKIDNSSSTENNEPLPDNNEDGNNTDSDTDVNIPESPENTTPPATELPEEEPEDEKKRTYTYIRSKVNGLNLRSGAGTSYSSVGYINTNDMVSYKGISGKWYITEYKGKTAYVSADSAYTEIFKIEDEHNETTENIINEGLKLLGFPYVYGAVRLHDGKGNFLKNFDDTKYDCSSLMQYMFYYGAKVNLNVTTRTQVVQGNHVPKNELKRGDLMFFTNSSRYNNTGVERIGHVALYLGENYILHTASDYAVIEPISSQRWNYYIESRRVH